MSTLTRELPYWLWGGVLLLWALLTAFLLAGAPARVVALTEAAPGFTVPEAHVGAVRVIPQASAALVSPCAAQDGFLAVGAPALAEL